MTGLHQNLHDLESHIIEIKGLMQALQQVLPDGATHTCVANALAEKIVCLERGFYVHWHDLFPEYQTQDEV
ncbi:MAG: hypothetical protein H6867_04720 [Rhodospirillales bacterium]|nr:hypothetical protein [Rhodospirillales bacterium]MCB9994804.1 hypothetical protein [Rhodospirillales bacterium]